MVPAPGGTSNAANLAIASTHTAEYDSDNDMEEGNVAVGRRINEVQTPEGGPDDGGSTASGSTTGNGSGSGAGGASGGAPMPALAQKEDQLVTRSKIMVVFVLLLATALVATMTYRYTKNEEEKDFAVRVRYQLQAKPRWIGWPPRAL